MPDKTTPTDEMVLAFMNTYDRLRDGSKDAPSLNHFTAGRTSLTRSGLTAALDAAPTTDEGPDPEQHDAPTTGEEETTRARYRAFGDRVRAEEAEEFAALWKETARALFRSRKQALTLYSEAYHRATKAEREKVQAQEAAKTLGKVIEDQCRDIAKITRSEHLVSEGGDADWGAIWECGHEMADKLEKAERERDEAIAHDRQPYPTAHAYEAACKALGEQRARAEKAEQERDEARAKFSNVRADLDSWLDPLAIFDAHKSLWGIREARSEFLEKNLTYKDVRRIVELAFTPKPKRPDGAEEIEALIREANREGDGVADKLADRLASRGVRAVTEDGAS